MVKFDVLQNNQRLMSPLGIYCNQNQLTPTAHNFFKSIPTYLISFSLINFIILSMVKLCSGSYEFDTRVGTLLAFIANIQAFGLFLNLGLHIEKSTALHQKLQSIVNREGLIFFFTFQIEIY